MNIPLNARSPVANLSIQTGTVTFKFRGRLGTSTRRQVTTIVSAVVSDEKTLRWNEGTGELVCYAQSDAELPWIKAAVLQALSRPAGVPEGRSLIRVSARRMAPIGRKRVRRIRRTAHLAQPLS